MTKKKENDETVGNETLQGSPIQCKTNQYYDTPQAVNPAVKGELIEHINNLIAAVNIAQSKGAFNLEEAGTIWSSIQRLNEIING